MGIVRVLRMFMGAPRTCYTVDRNVSTCCEFIMPCAYVTGAHEIAISFVLLMFESTPKGGLCSTMMVVSTSLLFYSFAYDGCTIRVAYVCWSVDISTDLSIVRAPESDRLASRMMSLSCDVFI